MTTAAESLNTMLGIDTSDFKSGLYAANRELRVLESGFRASVSTLDDWANTVTGVELRQKNLTSQIDIQKVKVAALREEHQRLVDTNGKTSISAKNAEIELNKENQRLGKMQIELAGTVTGLKNLHEGNDAAGRSTKELREAQEPLSQTFKKSWTEINSVIGVAKTAFQLLKGVVDGTVGTFVKYADQVRTISQVTGATAEETSRLLQVTDDYKIDAEALTTVMKKMASEGFDFTIESLAELSDQYLKLNDGVERQLFLNEKFGKQGTAFAEIMLQGGDAIRNQAAEISNYLILTEESLVEAREYEKQTDNLADAFEGLTIAVGKKAVPALTDFTKFLANAVSYDGQYRRALELGINVGENFWTGQLKINGEYATQEELVLAIIKAEKELAPTTDDVSTSMEKAAVSTDMFGYAIAEGEDGLQQLNKEFGFIINFASQYERNLKNVKSAEKDLKQAEAELFAMSQPGWKGTADQVQTAQDKVDGLKEKLSEAQQASLDATNEMIAGFLQAQLTADGSFTEEDIQKVLDYRFEVGLLTQEAYDAALEALKIAQNLAGIPQTVNVDVNVRTIYTSTGSPSRKIEALDEFGAIPQATGGNWLVRKPTLFLAGEAGMELATFTPINSGMENAVRRLGNSVRRPNGGLSQGYAGAGLQDQAAPINVEVTATVASEIDMHKLGREVAEEIRRNK